MIARELLTVAFHNEVSAKKTEKTAYEVPTLNTIGTAQELLQGGWCTGDFDGYSNSFSREPN